MFEQLPMWHGKISMRGASKSLQVVGHAFQGGFESPFRTSTSLTCAQVSHFRIWAANDARLPQPELSLRGFREC
jgi:hypothetical protein